MSIVTQTPWTRQPQGVTPLAGGVNALATLNAAQSIANPGKALWTPTTNGVTSEVGAAGKVLRFAGGASTGKWTTTIPSYSGDVWAVFVVANIAPGSGGGSLGRIMSGFNGTTSAPIDIYVDAAGSQIVLQRSFSGVAAQYSLPTGIGTTATPAKVVVWMSATAGVAPRCWVDGVERVVSTLSASTGTVSAGNTTLCIGGRPDVTTRQLAGDVALGALLFGSIDPVKVSLNPWQIFAPLQRRIWAGAAVVGGNFYNPISGRGGAAAQPVWAGA
jgi:hypothetical protein